MRILRLPVSPAPATAKHQRRHFRPHQADTLPSQTKPQSSPVQQLNALRTLPRSRVTETPLPTPLLLPHLPV